jgi:diguanylate cyclase (GGDEF)-like protein
MKAISLFLARGQSRLRLRLLGSVGASLLLCLWLSLGVLLERVDPIAPLVTTATVILISGLIYFLIDTDRNVKFSDPSLTVPVVLIATAVVLTNSLLLASPERYAIQVFILMAFSFAAFTSKPTVILKMVLGILGLYSVSSMIRFGLPIKLLLPSAANQFAHHAWLMSPIYFFIGCCAYYGAVLHGHRSRSESLRILADSTFQFMSEAVVNLDTNGKVVRFNSKAEAILGVPLHSAQGKGLEELLHERIFLPQTDGSFQASSGTDSGSVFMPADRALIGAIFKSCFALKLGTELRHFESSTVSLKDSRQQARGFLITLRDVTEQQTLMDRLSYDALHDALTGLLNRRGLDKELADISRDLAQGTVRTSFGLMILDLDNLKIVNDACGHAAGDKLIQDTARVLRESCRTDDVLARFGGDEFAIVIRDCDENKLLSLAKRFAASVKELNFNWEGRHYPTGASVGCVIIDQNNADPMLALAHADSSLYLAKESAKGSVQLFTSGDAHVAQKEYDLSMVYTVHDALINDRFILYAQCVRATVSNQADYFEVLLRLNTDDGIVAPNKFLPSAERFGLMPRVDQWVISQTFVQLRKAFNAGVDLPKFALNLSAQSIQEAEFLNFLTDLLKREPVLAKQISFELTETVAIQDRVRAKAFIDAVREFGCCFALDDVGAGFNSLSLLQELKFDRIKIDGYYTQRFSQDAVHRVIVDSLIKAGNSLNLSVVAEMVDNETVANELTALGVDYLQGYLYHRPESLAVILARSEAELSRDIELFIV